MTPEEKLAQHGFSLSAPPAPAANYLPVTRMGDTLFVSGQLSSGPDGLVTGLLGRDLDVAAGQKAAALSTVNILAQLRFAADLNLSRVRILKLTVLVASVPDFTDQHLVANGASDLFADVLGENGRHARAAFGVAALPLGAAVEIEAVVEALR